MRTTIRIDDGLYRRVKERAARTGRTVGDVITDAVVRLLADEDRPADVQPLPTYGTGGLLPGVDLSDNSALRDLMDADHGDAVS